MGEWEGEWCVERVRDKCGRVRVMSSVEGVKWWWDG